MKQDGSAAPAYATIVSATRVVTIVTTDVTMAGSVSLRIVATGSQSNKASNTDFTLTLTNPCTTTSFGAMPAITDVTGLLVGGSTTKTFNEVTDTAGAASTLATLCGSRTYTVTNAGITVPWATITGPAGGVYTITFAPN